MFVSYGGVVTFCLHRHHYANPLFATSPESLTYSHSIYIFKVSFLYPNKSCGW